MKNQNKYQVVEVEEFAKDLYKLAKKYPTSVDLVENLFKEFEKGFIQGDVIPGLKVNGGRVYKTRLENPDANKGKSGGFRIIWFIITSDNEIYPLTIYSKSDQVDITNKKIQILIRNRIRSN